MRCGGASSPASRASAAGVDEPGGVLPLAYSEKYLSFMVASAAVVVPYMASEAGCPPGWTPGGGDMAPVGDVRMR